MTEVTDVTDTVFAGTNHEGRRLLRIEARNAQTPIERKPEPIKIFLIPLNALPRRYILMSGPWSVVRFWQIPG